MKKVIPGIVERLENVLLIIQVKDYLLRPTKGSNDFIIRISFNLKDVDSAVALFYKAVSPDICPRKEVVDDLCKGKTVSIGLPDLPKFELVVIDDPYLMNDMCYEIIPI